uniref:Pentatricopeptide repeat-containing protein At5g08490 n=1 Tax=Nelumbo nucifera TaxID=4432 RepID=A0A822ZVH8_NELNU|nr:TPA_asm: hypothetical protein HUJ06_018447 [Nelumbo nucifera]
MGFLVYKFHPFSFNSLQLKTSNVLKFPHVQSTMGIFYRYHFLMCAAFCTAMQAQKTWTPSNPRQSNLLVWRSAITNSAKFDEKNGNIDDTFYKIWEQDSRTLDAMVRSYCINGRHEDALSLFYRSVYCSRRFRLSHQAFASLLKSCAAISAFELGKSFHGYGIKLGYELNQAISKGLMNMYAKCGTLDDCHLLFDQMDRSDPVTWNILLSGYAGSRHHDLEAMDLFYAMHVCEEEPKPNTVTIAIILPVCARSRDLLLGKSIHGYVIKSGFELSTLVGNSLVSMYAKCWSLHDAYVTFRRIAYKDVVSWNAIIAGYAENNLHHDSFELFRQMLAGPNEPNYATIVNVLPVCALLGHNDAYLFGKEIHCYVFRRSELLVDVSVCNALLSFYSRIGRLKEADSIFHRMKSRDLVSWNALIAGYASNGGLQKALELFHELQLREAVEPDSITLISIIPVCAQLRDLQEGQKIHEYVLRHPDLCKDTAVGNALVSFYAKCNDIAAAVRTFLTIPRRDLISWNTMLDAYAECGYAIQHVNLLHQMFKEGIKPDSITILAILRVFANVFCEEKVKEVHGYTVRAALLLNDLELTVGNMIIDAYAKCGNMEYALKIFESLLGKRNVVTGNVIISGYANCQSKENAEIIFKKMSERDLTTWNLMLRVYAENGCPDQAFILLKELQAQGMRPDVVSVMNLLPACAHLASVDLVRQCHGYMLRACLEDVRLNGALLDVYAKCGSINCAYKLFKSCHQKDLVMFTAIIGGYAMHGMGEEALGIFSQMLQLGIKLDHVILTAVLSACSHAGLVDEGLKLFETIDKVHGIKPTMEHYACVVDLLARAGRLIDAYSFVNRIPVEANANIWGTLLGACRIHHEVELGRVVADRLFDIEAGNIGNYVLMSNIYAADARWDGVKEVRTLMKNRDLKKPAGCSWIEVGSRRNIFVAGDFSHPQRVVIFNTLSTLNQQIRETF